MLSRVANSIYWLSRYMERADNVARFIDVNLQMMLDLPSGPQEQWQPLVSISGDDAKFSSNYAVATRDNVIKFLAFSAENPNSIVSCLRCGAGECPDDSRVDFPRDVGAGQQLLFDGQRRGLQRFAAIAIELF